MSKNESLIKEIDFLIQEFKGYFLVLTALLTGEAGLIYAVVSGDKPIFVLLLSVIGFVFLILLFAKLNKIKKYNLY